MKFSKQELGHLVHSKDLENRVWKPFWSAPEELDEKDDRSADKASGAGRDDWKDEWSVPFEDFQDLTVSNSFLNGLRGDVKSRVFGLVEVFLDDPDKTGTITEKCGIVKMENGTAVDERRAFDYSVIEDTCRDSGDDDLIVAAKTCKTEILKVLTFMELFERCKNFKECCELFDQLASIRKFSNDLLCSSVFEQWIKKCVDIDEAVVVLKKMEELGVAPSSSTIVTVFSVITDENHEDIFKKIEKIEPVKKALRSMEFSIEYVRRFADTIGDVKMFINKFMPLGCKFGEIVFFEFLRKCVSFIDGLVVFGMINTMVKKGGNDVPDVVLAELFRLAGSDANNWINVIEKIHSKEIPVSKTLIDGLKLSVDACALVKDGFAKTVGFGGDFETVYSEYRRRRAAKTCGYSRAVMDLYEKFRKVSMYAMDYLYICECRNAEDFVFMVKSMYDEGFEPTQDVIEGLNLPTDECFTAKKLLEEFFNDQGVDIERFYNLSRLGMTTIREGFAKVYGYVRDRVVADEVEDYFGLVVTMWEEGIVPSDKFIFSLDLSGKKWPVFKQILEERFNGKNNVPDVKAGDMDCQWNILYEHVRDMAESSVKDAARAKQKKAMAKKKRRW